MVATARSRVAAVEHELLGTQARQARVLVQRDGGGLERVPVARGVDVDLDDAGVGRHQQLLEPAVVRRRVALDRHRQSEEGRGVLDRGDQVERVLEPADRRQEDVQAAAARLHRDRGVGDPRDHHAAIGGALLVHLRVPGGARVDVAVAGGDLALEVGERLLRREGVDLGLGLLLLLGHPGQGVQRQAQAERRVAGDEVQAAAPELPGAGLPAAARPVPADGQDVAGRGVQPARELVCKVAALGRVRQGGAGRVEVCRHLGLLEQVVQGVLVRREHVAGRHAQGAGERLGEAFRLGHAVAVVPVRLGEQPAVEPDRDAVLAPEHAQGPARQRLARIPLPLRGVEQPAGGEAVLEAAHQHLGALALVLAEGVGGPFRCIHVVYRHESGLAAVAQPHVHALQPLVDEPAGGLDQRPLRLGVGLGDPRVLAEARDLVAVAERRLADVGEAVDRRCARRVRCAGERDVALAGEESGRRVEPDPAGARHVHLRPGVQVGEVHIGSRRAVERFLVGPELHQVARHEARCEAEVAQDLDQQPAGVAAGAEREIEGLVGRLHAGLEPDRVADGALQVVVDADEEVDGVLPAAADAL